MIYVCGWHKPEAVVLKHDDIEPRGKVTTTMCPECYQREMEDVKGIPLLEKQLETEYPENRKGAQYGEAGVVYGDGA